ncbi:HAMP domain-containing protein [Acidobacteria bacterium AB60]|nr:HAMP domain-containing protein [Acidobacteria bacterium AB60]
MRLRSLFVGTLLSMVAILALSFVVFRAIGDRMQRLTIDPTFDRFDELQVQFGQAAYEEGGLKELREYEDQLDHIFKGRHYLADARGIDIISGIDLSSKLPPAPETKSRLRVNGNWLITHRSHDGKYWFVAEGPTHRPQIWTFLPYYFLVIGATAAVFWLAAVGVINPIRRIASTIAAFGDGNLSVRVNTRRPDEIGQLGRSFNEMAERLERLIVSERRLLGDISHELRSPLARLKFAVKLARTSPDSKAAIDRIEKDVDRIASLVSDIVEITAVEGDPALRLTEPVSIGGIVEEVVRDCQMEAEARGCRIVLANTHDGEVLGSRELLRRAIENVVRNAIRYSPEGAPVEVSLTDEAHSTLIVVRDHGPGVPDDALARLFDPFFRVEEARNTNGGGSGLGLSIAKRAVQAHHGAIAAENAAPGLRVSLAIPLLNVPATPAESVSV